MFLICSTLVVIDFVLTLLTPDMTTNSFEVGEITRPCATETASDLSQVLFNNLMSSIEDFLFATNILLADGLLIYRCFVLWKETRWSRCTVVLPILLLLASSAAGYVRVYYDLERWHIRRDSPLSEAIPPPNWSAFTELYSYLATATYILLLATTVLTTLLIASRIWWFTCELEKGLGWRSGSRYRRTIAIVIESGAMYSVSLIIQVVISYISPQYGVIVANIVGQLMGIAPTLIIVRLGLGKGVETTFRQPTASCTSQILSRISHGNTIAREGDDVESRHEPHLIREQPSKNEMIVGRPTIEEVNISDRMSGSPPVEGAKLEGFNLCKHWDSGSE